MEKQRADLLLFSRGLAPSRERARALIRAGQVTADGRPVAKPAALLMKTPSSRSRTARCPMSAGAG